MLHIIFILVADDMILLLFSLFMVWLCLLNVPLMFVIDCRLTISYGAGQRAHAISRVTPSFFKQVQLICANNALYCDML